MEKQTNSTAGAELWTASLLASKKPLDLDQLESLMHEIDTITSLSGCDMLDRSRTAGYTKMIQEKKEQFVLAVHNTKIQEQKGTRKNGKRYVIFASRPNGESNYIKSATYEGLIGKLYDHYTGKSDETALKNIFKKATLWKAQRNISAKSIVEYKRLWDKYFANNPIADVKIEDLDVFTLTDFYDELCMQYKLTWRQLQHVRNVTSYIMDYCIKKRLISHNPANDIIYKDLPFARTTARKDKIKKTPFPLDMIPDIIDWCHRELKKPRVNPLHPYGIIIGLALGDRFGELRGMRWRNIDFEQRLLTIDDQSVPQYSINDDLTFNYEGHQLAGHIKGYEEPVSLPIPDEAFEAFLKIKDLGLDDEYVFPDNHFRHGTFNNYIKRMAGDLGLDPTKYSSHCLRATAATNLYQKSHDIFLVQRLLHHTTPDMSMKYVKDLDIARKMEEIMRGDLLNRHADHCGPKIASSLMA